MTREDGAIAWGAYTDHEPVEIELRINMKWQPIPNTNSSADRPDWGRMLGPTEEAKVHRLAF